MLEQTINIMNSPQVPLDEYQPVGVVVGVTLPRAVGIGATTIIARAVVVALAESFSRKFVLEFMIC